MKNICFTLAMVSILSFTVISCKDKVKEATTTEAEAPASTDSTTNSETYLANTETSTIEWKGSKPTGSHNGTIAIESGSLEISEDNIIGGTFNIDMTSITVKDIPAEDEKNGKLLGHLNSPDFFDSENHPMATFTVTGTENSDGKTMLSGNLAIKGIENNITFQVTLSKNKENVILSSETFSIDRSKWDIRYGSKSFFDNLGDKFINDDIELKILVNTSKS
ncbi:YceI family protein [uncultured Algibacter sp.]|uniref:YceI family protein n=1 Tax=uncultured Algibacter sp. TaxID=298659 RepID=UPI00260FDD79|nr:YceI family protein [uncultured Algibacter sp.]